MDEKAVKDTQEINLRAGAKRRSEDARSQASWIQSTLTQPVAQNNQLPPCITESSSPPAPVVAGQSPLLLPVDPAREQSSQLPAQPNDR